MVILTMISLIVAMRMPVLGAVILSFIGIPTFVIVLIWGYAWFVGYSALTMILSAIVTTPATALLLIPMILLPAAMLSGAIRLGVPPLRAIVLTLLSATLLSSGIWNTLSDEHMNPVREEFSKQVVVVEQRLDEFQKKGTESEENIEAARESLDDLQKYTFMLIPTTFLFVWHLFALSVTYVVASRLVIKLGARIDPVPPFPMWRLDWHIIWLFIGGWFLFHFVGASENIALSKIALSIGANCLAISSIIYFIAGLSLLFFMFDKYQIGSVARVGFSCLALVLTQAIIWFGIIDVWADLRTPKTASVTPDDSDDF